MSRILTTLARRADPLIDTRDPPLTLTVQNGRATAYFYPGFVLVVDVAKSDFAIIDLKNVDVGHHGSRFTEEEAVPGDATVVGKTWAKSNKNGTRDKRFKDNCELPVMLYGMMSLSAGGGLDEAFMFSDNDACGSFVASVTTMKAMLRSTAGRKRVDGGSKALPH